MPEKEPDLVLDFGSPISNFQSIRPPNQDSLFMLGD